MATKLSDLYADTVAPSFDYPQGSAKNVSTPTGTDGTPWEKTYIDNLEGFLQSLLAAGGVIPNGNADTVRSPQLLTALINLRWYSYVDYEPGTEVVASTGIKYVCKQANGPSTTTRNPVSSTSRPTYWREASIEAAEAANPVGTIRIFAVSTNPSTLLGFGTWVREAAGRSIFGYDGVPSGLFGTNGDTGGSVEHSHEDGNPANPGDPSNGLIANVSRDGWGTFQSLGALQEPTISGRLVTGAGKSETNENLESLGHASGSLSVRVSGNTATSDNVPPYIVRYIWRRSA